jgi:flagellar hook assembly protein FlgD
VRLTIVDVLGRPVTTLVDGVQGPGPHVVRWNGRDGHGKPLAAGIYTAWLQSAGEERQARLVILR